jgi:hypothetical protein
VSGDGQVVTADAAPVLVSDTVPNTLIIGYGEHTGMNRPVFVVLLCSCVLLFGFAAVPGSVAGQDGTAERSLNETTVSPGATVEVTVTADLGGVASVDFADAWGPAAAETSVVSVSFDRAGLGVTSTEEVALFSEGEVTADSVEIVYTLSVPADADPGTVYEWVPAQDGDGSFLSVGDDNRPIDGDQSFEVAGDDGDGGTDDGSDGNSGDDDGDGGSDGTGDGDDESNGGDGGSDGGDGDNQTDDGDNESGDGSGPGFGLVAVVLGVALLSVSLTRRSEST